jgi:hypothetical protein
LTCPSEYPLSERFAGPGGFLVAWATQYIIR